MKQKLLSGLSIRSGVVRQPDVGYLLACDPKMEEEEILHTKTYTWKAGRMNEGSLNFSAHSCCIISHPEPAWVMVAGHGEYAVTSKNSKCAGNIFDCDSNRKKYGAFRSVTDIAGRAHAVGGRGMVYRLDGLI